MFCFGCLVGLVFYVVGFEVYDVVYVVDYEVGLGMIIYFGVVFDDDGDGWVVFEIVGLEFVEEGVSIGYDVLDELRLWGVFDGFLVYFICVCCGIDCVVLIEWFMCKKIGCEVWFFVCSCVI